MNSTQLSTLFQKTALAIALSTLPFSAMAASYNNTVNTSTVLSNGDSINTVNTGVSAGAGVLITGTTGGLTINSTGTGAATNGVYAQATGHVSLKGSSATPRSRINYAGASAGVDVFNAPSLIELSYFDIEVTQGIGANANYGTIYLDHTTFGVHGLSSGFNADNGGIIHASDIDILMTAAGRGMRTGSGGVGGTFIFLGTANAVNTVANSADGAYVQGGAIWFGVDPAVSSTAATGTTTSITTQGPTSHGINIAPSAGNPTVTGAGLTITTIGAGSNGAQTTSNGGIVLIGDNSIITQGTNANGLVTIGTGKIDAYANSGAGTLSITTNNASSAGIISSNNVNLHDSKVVISTLGQSAFGVYGSNGANISSDLNGSVTINTTGTSAAGQPASHALYVVGPSTTTGFAGVLYLGTTGAGAHGVFATNSGYPNLGSAFKIVTTGDNATAAVIDGVASALGLNDSSNLIDSTHGITTNGANAHAIRLQNGANETFDGSLDHILPGIQVLGAGSAVLNVANNSLATDTGTASTAGTASALTIGGNTALNMTMTPDANTWGAKAEETSTITFSGNSSTGGTGLWAVGNGHLSFAGTPNAAGSRIKLDDNSVLDVSGTTAGVSVGSLDSTSATAKVLLVTQTLTIGADNVGNNGSLFNDATYAGVIGDATTTGSLVKTGTTTQRLTGTGSQVGNVDVTGGTLSFEQNGGFAVGTNYTTQNGGITALAATSQLNVTGIFQQAAGSTLNVTLGSTQPMITADTATLSGNLNVIGFTGSTFTRASQLTNPATSFTLIHANAGITGNFVNNPLTPGSGLDYIIEHGYVSASGNDYNLGFQMAWTDGGQANGTGSFTLAPATNFNVDIPLADQVGTFDSGWGGKSLTKAGGGTLTLSAINTYTGDTTVQGGTLIVSAAPTAGDTTAYGGVLSVANGATLQTSAANIFNNAQSVAIDGKWALQSGAIQTANNLSGTSTGLISLGNANLTANNTSDTTFAGIISDTGGLNKTGLGKLTLSGANTYTGQTNITAGTLSIGTGGSLVSDTAVTAGNTFEFASANNLTYAGNISGAGSLTQVGNGKTTLTGANSSIANVTVSAGTLDFGTIRSHIAFVTAGDSTTQSGGTTSVSLGSALNVGGSYLAQNGATTFLSANAKLTANSAVTLASGSTLKVILGSRNPAIIANSADITDATFHMVGFGGSATVNASDLPSSEYNVIKTTSGITNDFSNNPLKNTAPDYLIKHGYVSIDRFDYNLSFQMAWTNGGQANGTGSFTMETDTTFNVDVPLANQGGIFDSGWDGKSLTKAGEGILTLSTANTYTGDTNVKGGTLIVSAAPTAGDTTAYAGQLGIDSGATLQTSAENIFTNAKNVVVDGHWALQGGATQIANNLSGANTGFIDIGGVNLTADNTQDTVYGGAIVGTGSLIKTGANNLTLTGNTAWTGDTQLQAGILTLDGSAGGAQLVSNIVGTTGSSLSLQNGARLTGTIDPTNVSIDATSIWDMPASSIVQNLTQAGQTNFTNTVPGNTLTVQGDFIGNGGTIALNAVLGDDTSVTDKVIVQGNSSGTAKLAVNNVGGTGAQTVQGIKVVQVAGSSAATFTLAGRAVAGAYEYNLGQVGSDWYLSSKQTSGCDATDPNGSCYSPEYRPEGGSYLANRDAANAMFIHTMHDRLGEPQFADDTHTSDNTGSGWARAQGNRTQTYAAGAQLDETTRSHMLQVGGDFIHWQGQDSRLHLGLMFGAGSAQSKSLADGNTAVARGSVDGYALGLYGTWFARQSAQKTGLYLDGWAQYGHYDNKVDGDQLNSESYKSHNIMGSLETGYAFLMKQTESDRWYVEPQAQVIYTTYRQDDIVESNGTHVSSQNNNGVTTRLGGRIYGRNKIANSIVQPFVEANWWYGQNKTAMQMDSAEVAQDTPKNRYEVKMGVQAEIGKNWNLWGNVGLQTGANSYSNVQGQAGVKYIW